MLVQMIFEGGPLDGEFQVVQSVSLAPRNHVTFYLPHRQSFDDDGNVVEKGLETTYVYQGEIPLVPGDYWQANYLYGYGGGKFHPLPDPITPPQARNLAGSSLGLTQVTGHLFAAAPVKSLAGRVKGQTMVRGKLLALTGYRGQIWQPEYPQPNPFA